MLSKREKNSIIAMIEKRRAKVKDAEFEVAEAQARLSIAQKDLQTVEAMLPPESQEQPKDAEPALTAQQKIDAAAEQAMKAVR
jgi:hypothetical protein